MSTARSESSESRRRAQGATCSRSRGHEDGRRSARTASSRFRWASWVVCTRHSGWPRWRFTGNKAPESVAEHSFRVGVIGSVLAMMEGVDPPGAR
ncbi:hypothetical protein SAMN05216489_09879 [Streptomyces sp. 3213]|nr:hypothetical protein SAMN05216489_09879 [Streptomyces sp. 3213] [Streptomyces sp. 3213.3]